MENESSNAEFDFQCKKQGGRPPMTWYSESFTGVPMSDMNMRPDPCRNYPGRTYRFYTGDTVHNFGYELIYLCNNIFGWKLQVKRGRRIEKLLNRFRFWPSYPNS
ncbi:beta-xylosidase 3 [Striga asiatica]|uniref:Beta-xylosidase 3 n=1 Tax=Striga asiatica TaxID=4170 RepID=A0A5A7PGW1_STRAF|nr:beta-xylosidase 3 [Striga asiatica]